MKRIVRAGLLFIGMLMLLAACGEGKKETTVTLTPNKTSAVANASDTITVTATSNSSDYAGTTVQFSIPSNATALFTNGSKSYSTTVTGSSATATIINFQPGTVAVTATALGVSGSSNITFTAPTSNSTLLWSTVSSATVGIPILVWASAYPVPAENNIANKIPFVVNNNDNTIAAIKEAFGYDNNPGSITLASDDAYMYTTGTYPYTAPIYLKCKTTGTVTITATCPTYTPATLTVTCVQ